MALEWGEARTEITALKDEINRKIKKGQPGRKIYRDLKAAGLITMSEPTFYSHLKRLAGESSESTVSATAVHQPSDRGHEQQAIPTPPPPVTPKPKPKTANIAGVQQLHKPTEADLWGPVEEGEKA
tara:strand:- start:786 stop:1163 length:378 start_codon:yes stop_codon:yes gene_type:complete